MFVSDLKPNQAVDEITLEIVDMGEAKEFNNFRGTIRVANAKAKDETGQCTLTLWNDEIEKYSVGQKIRIKNGWCKEYRGEIQVSSGKYGKIEVLGGEGESQPAPKKQAPKKKKAGKKPAHEDEEELEGDMHAEDEDIFSEGEEDLNVKYEKLYGKE